MCTICSINSTITQFNLYDQNSYSIDHGEDRAANDTETIFSSFGDYFKDPTIIAADTSLTDETPVFLNADERGGIAGNGKPSFNSEGAGNQITRSGLSWGSEGVTITYGFRSTAPATMPSDTSIFSRFNATQITQAELSLQSWSDVANINFTRVGTGNLGEAAYSNSATMLFANYGEGSEGSAAFAYLPSPSATGFTARQGDSWYNVSLAYNAAPAFQNYGRLTLVHEIGHAIGLSHPGNYNADPGVSITYANNAEYYEDSAQYTVMSYFNESNTGAEFGNGRYAAAPMLDDITAVQRLYGANMDTRSGDTTYGVFSNAGRDFYSSSDITLPVFAVWDGGGFDTLNFSIYNNNQLIDLREGHFSNVAGLVGNVSIAHGAVIERGIGGRGDDTLISGSHRTSRFFDNSYNDIDTTVNSITKTAAQNISTFGTALSIDLSASLGRSANAQVFNSDTLPHTTINGTGSGQLDYYVFNITEAGTTLYFDMDNTTASYDPYLYLYNGTQNLIASNDDSPIDAGSTKTQDSFLQYTFGSTGTYYLLVNEWSSGGMGTRVPNGATYQLNITFERPDLEVIDGYTGYTLEGGNGADTLLSGLGTDTLTGGAGADTFRIPLLSGTDTITDFEVGVDKVDLSAIADQVLITEGRSASVRIFEDSLTLQQVGNDTILAYIKTGKFATYDADDALIIFSDISVGDISLETDFIL